MNDIHDRLARVILDTTKSDFSPEALIGKNLIEELGISSVDALEILIRIESEFGIMINDEDLSQTLISSFSNIENYIKERLASAA